MSGVGLVDRIEKKFAVMSSEKAESRFLSLVGRRLHERFLKSVLVHPRHWCSRPAVFPLLHYTLAFLLLSGLLLRVVHPVLP